MYMEETQKKKIHRGFLILSIVLMAAVIAFMVWCAYTGRNEDYLYNGAVIGFLAVYCFLSDYLEPKLCREFEGITEEQRASYIKFAALDVAGYAGLAFFLLYIGNEDSSIGLIGVVIYALVMKPKREARDAFYGMEKPEEKEQGKETEYAGNGEELEEPNGGAEADADPSVPESPVSERKPDDVSNVSR